MYRQGDIMVKPVNRIPQGLKAVPLDKGRVILAYGEVTGHAHAIVDRVELLASDVAEIEQRFLRVEAETSKSIDAWECHNSRGETCWIPAYQPKEAVEACELTVVGRSTVDGVVVEHEEHLHFVVTPGDYELVGQREYSPEEIRRVAD
jgi:hypothetical protein